MMAMRILLLALVALAAVSAGERGSGFPAWPAPFFQDRELCRAARVPSKTVFMEMRHFRGARHRGELGGVLGEGCATAWLLAEQGRRLGAELWLELWLVPLVRRVPACSHLCSRRATGPATACGSGRCCPDSSDLASCMAGLMLRGSYRGTQGLRAVLPLEGECAQS